jgi:hypothetical protein
MQAIQRFSFVLVPLCALVLVLQSGCGKKEGVDDDVVAKKKTTKAARPAEVDGYALSIKGKVTFNGAEAEMKVNTQPPQKDQQSCPSQIPVEGWYVKDKQGKGVQFAVVYLKAPRGMKFPVSAKEVEKPEKAELEIRQPRCQFEPRALVLHPSQKLKVFNDSSPPISHDAKFEPGGQKTMPPGTAEVFDLVSSNVEPIKVSCGIHAGTMSAYIWKFEHPYGVVTDENGNFELKHVPVLKDGKLEIWVWHEMLQGNKLKQVGTVDVGVGKSGTLDIAIPN